MIEEERVRSEFLRVRREYFPRWKAGETWTVHFGFRSDETAEDGYCDLQARRVYISRQRTRLNLRLVLVHECCHAVTSGGHQTKWRSRMAIAASTADKLGDAELATRLREEVEGYRRALREGAPAIYATIEDAVIEEGLPADDAITAVAHEYSFTRGEFLRFYPRAERVAEAAHKKLVRYQDALERFQKSRARR